MDNDQRYQTSAHIIVLSPSSSSEEYRRSRQQGQQAHHRHALIWGTLRRRFWFLYSSAKTWNLDPASKALTKTVRFYIYGPGLVSQSTFEDEYFREMLQAYYEAAGGVPSWP